MSVHDRLLNGSVTWRQSLLGLAAVAASPALASAFPILLRSWRKTR